MPQFLLALADWGPVSSKRWLQLSVTSERPVSGRSKHVWKMLVGSEGFSWACESGSWVLDSALCGVAEGWVAAGGRGDAGL